MELKGGFLFFVLIFLFFFGGEVGREGKGMEGNE